MTMTKGKTRMAWQGWLVVVLVEQVLLLSGRAWAGYTQNGDGTVTDTVTGLMWQQQNDSQIRDWWESISYCQGLSQAGFDDWRLPDVMELASIIDDSTKEPAIDTTVFPGTAADDYWSSTSKSDDGGIAWVVGFYSGVVDVENYFFGTNDNHKYYNNYVRCVRSGPVSWPIDHLVGIAGTINDSSGLAVAGASVATTSGASTVSDDQGHYALTLAPGAATLSFSKTGYFAITKSATVVAGQSKMLDATLTLGVPLSGTVKDFSTGNPIAGVTVATTGASTATNPNGTYSLASLAPGVYTVIFTKSGYQTVTMSATVKAGQEKVLDVYLITPGPLNIITTYLDPAETASPYNVHVAISGGVWPLVFSKASGQLPPGLLLDPAFGTIGGTPSKSGSYTFAIGIKDKQGAMAEREFTIEVTAPLAITTLSPLARGTRGQAYQGAIKASGGTPSYRFSITAGALPAGMILAAPTGALLSSSLLAALDSPSSLAITSGGSSGGSAAWSTDTGISVAGGSSARSGTIGNSAISWMETTVIGPTQVAFRWMVSSGDDYLALIVDGSQWGKISGKVSWSQQTVTLGAGTHTLNWVYVKNASWTEILDCGWVDQLTMTPNHNGIAPPHPAGPHPGRQLQLHRPSDRRLGPGGG
jgi:hypothetical protein